MQRTILVCDDDKFTADLLTYALQKEGHLVHNVPNCESIWESVNLEEIDVILMDVMVPGMGGPAATQRLKDERGTDIKVIMISALHDLSQIAEDSGADGYLIKPFLIEHLRAML